MDFNWAVNKLKLSRAIAALTEEKKADPKVEINEETIKARYIKLAGLVVDGEPTPKARVKK